MHDNTCDRGFVYLCVNARAYRLRYGPVFAATSEAGPGQRGIAVPCTAPGGEPRPRGLAAKGGRGRTRMRADGAGRPGRLEVGGLGPSETGASILPAPRPRAGPPSGGKGRGEEGGGGSAAAAPRALREGGARRAAAAISHQMSPSAAKAAPGADNGRAGRGAGRADPKAAPLLTPTAPLHVPPPIWAPLPRPFPPPRLASANFPTSLPPSPHNASSLRAQRRCHQLHFLAVLPDPPSILIAPSSNSDTQEGLPCFHRLGCVRSAGIVLSSCAPGTMPDTQGWCLGWHWCLPICRGITLDVDVHCHPYIAALDPMLR